MYRESFRHLRCSHPYAILFPWNLYRFLIGLFDSQLFRSRRVRSNQCGWTTFRGKPPFEIYSNEPLRRLFICFNHLCAPNCPAPHCRFIRYFLNSPIVFIPVVLHIMCTQWYRIIQSLAQIIGRLWFVCTIGFASNQKLARNQRQSNGFQDGVGFISSTRRSNSI